jgi:hypothetical protein
LCPPSDRRSSGSGRTPDLHRQAEALAEALHPLGRLGHDHEPAGGRDHDLLPQQRPAATLDQPQPVVDLVRAVQGQVQLHLAVQVHQLDAGLTRARARALRCHCGPDGHAVGPALADALHQTPDRPPGAQPDVHARLNQLQRGGGSRFTRLGVAVAGHARELRTVTGRVGPPSRI